MAGTRGTGTSKGTDTPKTGTASVRAGKRPAARGRTTPSNRRKSPAPGLNREAERAFDALGDAVSIQDRNFRVLFQNRSHQKMAGSQRGAQCHSAYAHQKSVCPGCPIAKTFKDGKSHTLIKQQVDERRVMEIEIASSPLRDAAGKVFAAIEIVRDISEQRRMENALRDERNFVSTVIDTLDALVLVLDTKGRIVRFNRACEKVTGYNNEEVKGRHVWELFLQKDHAEEIREAFRNLTAVPFPNAYQSTWVTRDRRQRLISWHNSVLRDWEGNVRFVIPTGIDITEHHRADESLAAEKEQLAVTLRSIGDGVITTDTACRVILLNKVAEELTGWSQSEASGKTLDEVFHIISERTRQRIKAPVEKALRQGSIEGLANHTVLLSRAGTERIIADSAAPIRDRNGAIIGAVLVFRDMTEKRIMEAELLKAQKIESLGVLAGGIAHDYNNLLTAILGNINLANTLLAKGDAEPARERLVDAERASVRAKELTRQLLTFAKGGAPVKKVAALAELVRESAGFAFRGSPVRCELSLPKDLWAIEADEGQISQVLNNLLINAVQSLPEQNGTVAVQCENVIVPEEGMQLLPKGKYVKISVRDSGCGIPPEHLPKIFDPYFTTKKRGVGLGLATSYSVIRRHEGLITVESASGTGTVFHVYLPAYFGGTPARPEPDEGGVSGTGRILVMDDDGMVRTASAEMLRSLGYTIEVARDGAEAVQRYQYARSEGRPFDMVILDANVPGGMGGKDAMKAIRKLDPRARVIMTTGYADDAMQADIKRYGFAGMMQKPYTAQELGKMVRKVIAEKAPGAERKS